MRWWRRQLIVSAAVAMVLGGVVHAVADPRMNSNNFSVVESEVGGSGDEAGASTTYRFLSGVDGDGGSSLGENVVGGSASAHFQTSSGANTTAQPSLSFLVNTSSVNLGVLSALTASTATATFSVLNYTSYGYAVTIIGSPPTYGGNPINAMTTDATSSAGTEQFGVNTVFNPSPVTVGANPTQHVTTGVFSYGVAGDGVTGTYGTTRPYTIPSNYRFNSGEVIASAPKSSGQTDYTLAFLANIANTTPSGSYTGALTLVATGTY